MRNCNRPETWSAQMKAEYARKCREMLAADAALHEVVVAGMRKAGVAEEELIRDTPDLSGFSYETLTASDGGNNDVIGALKSEIGRLLDGAQLPTEEWMERVGRPFLMAVKFDLALSTEFCRRYAPGAALS